MDESERRGAKKRLRESLLARRRARGAEERARAGSVFRDTLMGSPWPPMDGTVACYYSVGTEPDTRPLVTALWESGTHVLLPVFLPDRDLDWVTFDGPDHLAPAGHGLLEPRGRRHGPGALERVDVVVCPALAVDHRGMRLGRGAGCYDRALGHKGPHTPAIALVYDEEFLDSLPTEPHDRPVDAVVTPGDGLRVFDPTFGPGERG